MEKHHHLSNKNLSKIIEYLDKPERMNEFPPEKLLKMLPIKTNDSVLDLGAGTGYLALPAADMVDGIVYALDINQNMLDIIDSKSKDRNITNINLLKGSLDDIPLPNDSIDISLASLVLHEVKPLSKTLKEVNRVLKEGGHFLCLEFEKNENANVAGPPMNIRIPSTVMEEELINSGFTLVEKSFLNDSVYVVIAKK